MITQLRVGIPVVGGKGWLGGVSHIELHVKAVCSLPKNNRPHLSLIVHEDSLDNFVCYRPFVHLFDRILFFGQNTTVAVNKIDLPFLHCPTWEDLFTKVDFYFPVSFNVLPDRCAASWIHDFQHKHLPNFFSARDIELRDELCRRIAEHSKLVFCSSHAVEKDYWRYYPQSQAQTRVLALRVLPEEEWYEGHPQVIQQTYELPEHFILCSNQFWVHKNHRCLFEAIAQLRQSGQEIHVVCTGLTSDFRSPGYFQELTEYILQLGIEDLIHILGLVPRADQIQLLRRSMFVVQPSLFEGLSLIVQECRALGKTIVLSDIDVHLEHEYGIYFEHGNSQALAQKISDLLPVSQPGPDLRREKEAKMQASGLAMIYGQQFCRLAEDALAIFKPSPIKPNSASTLSSADTPLLATVLSLNDDLTCQRKAVNSWLQQGFRPVSFATPDVAIELQTYFPDVQFISDIQGTDINAKVRFSLSDVMLYLGQKSKIFGLIEPDIHLFCTNLRTLIEKETPGCVLFGPKHDIQPVQADGEPTPGLGFIFFDAANLPSLNNDTVYFGQPWWDYWVTLISLIQKIPAKRITLPAAMHVVHENRYNIDDWIHFGATLTKYAPPPFELSPDTVNGYQTVLTKLFTEKSSEVGTV